MNKISIVGAGRVGESTAQLIAEQDLCKELMLVDIREGVPQGVALDIQETAPLLRFDTRVDGCHQAQGIKDSDLVIVTAGVPRKAGMTRSDVLNVNTKVIDDIVDNIVRYAPDALVLLVSNPVEALTYQAFLRSGFERNRVLGQAGVLDSTRMASFIALETGFSTRDINAMVLGGHGDTMVPMMRFTTISGIPVAHFLEQNRIQDIIERTRYGGAEILSLRRTSSAYDAPAAAITEMVDAIVHGRRRIMPAVAILQGEYGQSDIAMSVPCVLSDCGVEKVIELPLNDIEQSMFDDAVASIRADINNLK